MTVCRVVPKRNTFGSVSDSPRIDEYPPEILRSLMITHTETFSVTRCAKHDFLSIEREERISTYGD
jgi:hypothetical protein